MSKSTEVFATGIVERIRLVLAEDQETPLCVVLRISVTGIRAGNGKPTEVLDTLTLSTTGEQAANCGQFLRPARSVGVLASLARPPKDRRGIGRASAVIFIGPDSRVKPFRVSNAEALTATPEREAALAA